jgi:hypothetical protein
LLLDSSLNTPIPLKRVFFENNFVKIFDVTDANGLYYVDKMKATESSGSYKLRTHFEGDHMYYESKSSEVILAIEESSHDKDYENKRMPIVAQSPYDIAGMSVIKGFKVFHAFTYFEKGFDEEKEPPQIVSTIWLLSILKFNPIPLGIDKREGESIEHDGTRPNLSADLICSNNGDSLVIDCTVTVPSSEKLDKILNTSKYIQKYSGKRFTPVVITNKDAPISMQEATKNKVTIIDRSDIEDLLKLIMSNNIEQAIELFRSKIRRTHMWSSLACKCLAQ